MEDAIRVSEARKMLGVAYTTMLRIFKREEVKIEFDPLDKRRKYVKRADVERLKRAADALRGKYKFESQETEIETSKAA